MLQLTARIEVTLRNRCCVYPVYLIGMIFMEGSKYALSKKIENMYLCTKNEKYAFMCIYMHFAYFPFLVDNDTLLIVCFFRF